MSARNTPPDTGRHAGGRPKAEVPKIQITVRISPEAYTRLMLTVEGHKAKKDRPRSQSTPGCIVEEAIWSALGPLPPGAKPVKRKKNRKRNQRGNIS